MGVRGPELELKELLRRSALLPECPFRALPYLQVLDQQTVATATQIPRIVAAADQLIQLKYEQKVPGLQQLHLLVDLCYHLVPEHQAPPKTSGRASISPNT